MILRDILNVLPRDVGTNIRICYFDNDGYMYDEELYIRFEEDSQFVDTCAKFSLLIAEHFADAPVIELTNHFGSVLITIDMKVKRETVNQWKTEAADEAGLSHILRDWEE